MGIFIYLLYKVIGLKRELFYNLGFFFMVNIIDSWKIYIYMCIVLVFN